MDKPTINKTAILFISSLTIILLSLCIVRANKSDDQSQQQQPHPTSYLQRSDSNGRPQLMVALYCGSSGDSTKATSLYYNQYLDIETRLWRSHRETGSVCTNDKQEILNFCKKVYPDHDIRNIVESSRPYKIDNWCKFNRPKRRCKAKFTVKPYRCLEGTFQSDALLVPDRCFFDHVHNKSICESSEHWNQTASENCWFKGMKLESYAMLQPCGVGVFSGVEFVCCLKDSQDQQERRDKIDLPSTSTKSSDGSSFAQAVNGPSSWPKNPKYDLDLNEIKLDEDLNVKKHQPEKDQSQVESELDEDENIEEDDEDEDEYDDDSSSWNGGENSSTSTTTTTTTTTTTQRPIDHYLSHFDVAHEHDEFRRAELAVENSYRVKITNVMKEWSQLESRYEELKKRDPKAAEQFKKKMTHEFQKTVEALEEEGAAQRHQLASMHAERAMAVINRRKKSAMDCLTQTLDKVPVRTRQVEKCIVRLLKALEKDRAHTLRQFKNLLVLNTREALREKKIILDHLVTLNRAANQSIAMLDRSPILVDKLKTKIITLWHRLRNIPIGEVIDRDSEARIMDKYEEEVAQRKMEHERLKLHQDQETTSDASQEISGASSTESPRTQATNNNIESLNSDTNSRGQPMTSVPAQEPSHPSTIAPHHIVTNEAKSDTSRSQARHNEHDVDNEIHYQIDSAKFSHLKADPSHQELSYSIRHEPIEGPLRISHSTFLISACTLIIALSLFGMKYYNKHSARAYKRQGFAEVGRSCPEEKAVTNLQFNGYENPTYKFFEAEA